MGISPAPRFSATIRFVENNTFQTLLKENKTPSFAQALLNHWYWGPQQLVPSRYQGTTNIVCCLGGGLANGKQAAMSHLMPDLDYVDHFDRHIAPECEYRLGTFKKRSEKAPKPVSGVFIGGYDMNCTGANTFSLFKQLKMLLDKQRIPVSYFIGVTQKDHCSGNVLYRAANDTWYVYDHGGPPMHSMHDIKKRFHHVHVAPTDTVEFESANAKLKGLERPCQNIE